MLISKIHQAGRVCTYDIHVDDKFTLLGDPEKIHSTVVPFTTYKPRYLLNRILTTLSRDLDIMLKSGAGDTITSDVAILISDIEAVPVTLTLTSSSTTYSDDNIYMLSALVSTRHLSHQYPIDQLNVVLCIQQLFKELLTAIDRLFERRLDISMRICVTMDSLSSRLILGGSSIPVILYNSECCKPLNDTPVRAMGGNVRNLIKLFTPLQGCTVDLVNVVNKHLLETPANV
jgi:hypothetical protein